MDFAGLLVEKWMRVLTYEDLGSDELRLPKKFAMKYGNRLKASVVLKLRTGYEISILYNAEKKCFTGMLPLYEDFACEVGQMLVFESDGCSHFNVYVIGRDLTEISYPPVTHEAQRRRPLVVSLRKGGTRFVHYVKDEQPLFDDFEPPASLKRIFPLLRGHQHFTFSNGKMVEGGYNHESGKFHGLSKFCSILGLENYRQFNLVMFVYEESGYTNVSFFDDHFVEVMFPGGPLSVGLNSHNPRVFGRIEIVLQACHMYKYSYGVDVSTEYYSITAFWRKCDYIHVYLGERVWKLQVKARGSKYQRTTINDGWIQFRDELGLAEGDVVVLECSRDSRHHFALEILKNPGL